MEQTPDTVRSKSNVAITSEIANIVTKFEKELLSYWQAELKSVGTRNNLIKESELNEQCRKFLQLLVPALQNSRRIDTEGQEWNMVKDFLAEVSRSRGIQGFSPTETATFVLSIKRSIFIILRREVQADPKSLGDQLWISTSIFDSLALYTTEIFQKTREEVINRQQSDLLELSTPVVQLWDKILALPMIGTLDSNRTQVVMESLLQKIVETGSSVAILDITGVPTVDTLVAQHLIKTVTAAKLMGADCIISGIRPQIAATIVHLGVDLGNIITKATLADAFKVALQITRQATHKSAQSPSVAAGSTANN